MIHATGNGHFDTRAEHSLAEESRGLSNNKSAQSPGLSQMTISPALAGSTTTKDAPAAYELKCLIEPELVPRLEKFLADIIEPDPHSVRSASGHYQITTVSTDTVDWNVFRRQPGYASRKLRLRRYGNEPIVYLERKTRRGSRVRKQRSEVRRDELIALAEGAHDLNWNGSWFADQVRERQLRPVCVMTCERRAWVGRSADGPLRLTFDRGLSAALIHDGQWFPDVPSLIVPITDDKVICEFKFCGAMPAAYKRAIAEFGLQPGGFSKYRNCMAKLTGMVRAETADTEGRDDTEGLRPAARLAARDAGANGDA